MARTIYTVKCRNNSGNTISIRKDDKSGHIVVRMTSEELEFTGAEAREILDAFISVIR